PAAGGRRVSHPTVLEPRDWFGYKHAMNRRTFVRSAAAAAVLASFRSKLSFAKDLVADDPLLGPWTGAHGGFPRFDKIKVQSFKPGLTKAMDLYRTDVAAIASSKDAATFDNTIAAFENSGRSFTRATNLYGVFISTMNDKNMQKVEEEMAPVLAAFGDEIVQN